MFDTHCHLNSSRFKKDVDTVIQNAISSGVKYFVVPGYTIASSKRAITIAEKYSEVFAGVGIQPTEMDTRHKTSVADYVASEIIKLRQLLESSSKSIVAIGEIGLNRYNGQNKMIFAMQKPLFIAQLAVAREYNKSVIIHNRGATEEMLEILNKPSFAKASHSAKASRDKLAGKVVFHCCEADIKLLTFAQKREGFGIR